MPRTVDVHIAQVRKKLADAVRIDTVRGVGYRLDREVDRSDERGRCDARISLRTRLVVAFTGVALVVLLLSGLATYGLVRRSLQQHALQDMRARSADLAALVKSTDFAARPAQRLRIGLRAADMQAVLVTPDGALCRAPELPAPAPALHLSDIEPTRAARTTRR